MTSSIEIRHLRYFLAVASTENFTRAAERLHVTQSNVSQQMKDLETMLGARLFRRVGSSMRLTEAGRAFRKHAEVVLRKLDGARDAVANLTDLTSGRIELGVIPALQAAWVVPALEALARGFPGLTVAVHEHPSRGVETEVESGRFDFGLGIMTQSSPHLRYKRLFAEPLALLVPTGHVLARSRSVALRQLTNAPFVLLPDAFDLRQMVDEFFRRSGQRPRVTFEIPTIDLILATVKRVGVPTILPPIVLRGREHLGLRAVALSGTVPTVRFGLLMPRDGELSAAARTLANLVADFVETRPPNRRQAPRRRLRAGGVKSAG